MAAVIQPCTPHLEIVAFEFRLRHLAESLQRGRRTKIVTIGSSSTAGEPSATGEVKIVPYPARLELALRREPSYGYGRMIDVVNRGIGGQEAPEELARFESDVIDEMPALVIWQVGTNAVFHEGDYNPADIKAALAAGLEWLTRLEMDIVLMDLQYTTAVTTPQHKLDLSEQIATIIMDAARNANANDDARTKVNVFKRWKLMKEWVKEGVTAADLTDPEDSQQLHMSEWATTCVSKALVGAVVKALPPQMPAASSTPIS